MDTAALDYDNIVTALIQREPRLAELLKTHLEDYGEILPHVFFGELTRHIHSQIEAGNTEPVTIVLSFLESAAASKDPKVQELLVVSFFENLDAADPIDAQILTKVGPALNSLRINQQ